MTVSINGTSGIVNDATDLNYTGTLTGGTGVVNLGSGQVYKDASGNVGIGRVPNYKIDAYVSGTGSPAIASSNDNIVTVLQSVGNTQGNVGTLTSHPLVFLAGNTERARIDSSGNLLVGTTSQIYGTSRLVIVGSGANASIVTKPGADNYNPGIWLNAANSPVGSIFCSSTATNYGTSSDYRLKDTIAPMTGALAKVALLKPCTYKWKSDGSDGQGFIAHELDEVVPGCVTGEKDATSLQQVEITPAVPATFDADGNTLTEAVEAVFEEREVPQYQGIDTSFLVATLAAAIQELKAVVDEQATRITALEGTAA